MRPNIHALQNRVNYWLQPVQPLIDAIKLWLDVDGLRMSASMTFYGLLSLSPLVLLIVAMLGWWMDRSVVESTLLAQVESIMGERGASVVQGALASAQQPSEGGFASVVALVLLLSGATGVFVELQNAFDRLWMYGRTLCGDAPKKPWWSMAMLRLRGLAYVLIVGFLMMVTMVMSTAIKVMTQWAGAWLNMQPPGLLMTLLNESVTLVMCTGLFWGLMRVGGGPIPRKRYLLCGALLGAALFTGSKQVMAWYLANAAVVSAYGAAGSIVVVLMWIYVTSAILLLAGSFAKALDIRAYGIDGYQEGEVPLHVQAANAARSSGAAGDAGLPRTAGDVRALIAQPVLGNLTVTVQQSWPRSAGSQQSQVWPCI